jgi:hypothetical protein
MIELPSKKNSKWILTFLLALLINAIFMFGGYIITKIFLGGNAFNGVMFIVLFFAAIIILIFTVVGFFGGKYTFFYTNFALAFGAFVAGMYLTEDYAGWEYFTSVLMLFLYAGAGIIVGIVFDIVNKRKTNTNNSNDNEIKLNKIFLPIFVLILIYPIIEFFFLM